MATGARWNGEEDGRADLRLAIVCSRISAFCQCWRHLNYVAACSIYTFYVGTQRVMARAQDFCAAATKTLSILGDVVFCQLWYCRQSSDGGVRLFLRRQTTKNELLMNKAGVPPLLCLRGHNVKQRASSQKIRYSDGGAREVTGESLTVCRFAR